MATVKFLSGEKANIESGIQKGVISEGSILITEDTNEIAVVDSNKDVNFIKSRTQQAYTLNGTDIGALSNGTTIPEGTSIDDLLNMIVAKAVPADYVMPTVSASVTGGHSAGYYEVGSTLTTNVKSVFLRKDAGDLVNHTIYKNDTEIIVGTTSTINAIEQNFIVPDGVIRFNSKATYGDAPIKTNNLGQESKENWFEGNEVVSNNIDFVGNRKYFYGAGNGNIPTLTSPIIRNLANSKLSPAEGTTFEIPVEVGQQHVIFAYPATLRDVSQIKYVEANDSNMANNFMHTVISVGGADATESDLGDYVMDYKVYSYAMAVPALAKMTFKVTI